MGDCTSFERASEPAVATGALRGLLRQRLLATAGDLASVQDHLDCADLALAAGLAHGARSLRLLASLRLGCAEESEPAALFRRQPATGLPAGEAPASAVLLAVADLQRLLPCASSGSVTGDAQGIPTPPQPAPASSLPAIDHAALVSALQDALCAMPGATAFNRLDELLDRLDRELLGHSQPDVLAQAGAPIEQLLHTFAGASLWHFLRSVHPLAHAPFGSAELLHRAARAHPAGLGPYLANAGLVRRDSLDLLGLVQAAAGGGLSADEEDRWIVLLAVAHKGWRLHRLLEDLADYGRMGALRGVLTATSNQAGGAIGTIDRTVLLVLRDAGIDFGDMELAADAQRLIAEQSADLPLEWRILGDIHASAGETTGAQIAYHHGLTIDPGDAEIRQRMDALTAGSFAPFRVLRGYGERSRQRFAHQPAAASDPA